MIAVESLKNGWRMKKMSRLIDFDKLMEQYDFYNEFAVHDLRYLKKECLPFVEAIPIELYEQVKGERDIAIEQLKALNIELFEKPYLKAIPKEWIKNYARHKASKGFTEIDCYWQSWEEDVLKMIEEWEKENETN